MNDMKDETHYNFKGLFKYISTVISWTVFVLLMMAAVLLIYYYVSLQLYRTKGEKFEPAFSIYTIVSQSMEPTINVLDAIVNVKINDASDVEINDVITFISTWKVKYGMTVTHRVVGKKVLDDGSTCFITRGDNNPGEDEGCVKEANVIGVVKAVIPGLGKLQTFLSSSYGWIFVVLIPALYILVKDIFKIFGLMKETKNEDNKSNKDNKKEIKEENKKIEEEKEDIKIDLEDDDELEEENNDNEKKKLEKAYQDMKKVKNKK